MSRQPRPDPIPMAPAVLTRLRAVGNRRDAVFLQRYFKTGPCEYGEGDVFLGVRVPAVRKLGREFREASRREVLGLLKSRYHEARLLALVILAEQHERADEAGRRGILDVYLMHTRFINNWDLVDLSAPDIVGPHVDPANLHMLAMLAESPLVWERRIAMLATHYWIRRGELRPVYAVAEMLLEDEHDLMHKAVGWMLREAGKRDEGRMLAFLKKHYQRLPRTALRYAIERCSKGKRERYMRGEFS
jgi:3-methyladenine DNA glycosylase AlkD